MLIVGQGIAGSVLAFQLYNRGYDVQIIEDNYRTSSSKVAAGMWNPVIFKDIKVSWNADLLLPASERIYTQMEDVLGSKFYYPKEIVRIFPDVLNANEWDSVDSRKPLAHYLISEKDNQVESQLSSPFGYGIVKYSGWLDVSEMLKGVREYFTSLGRYTLGKFDLNEYDVEQGPVILCTGNALIESDAFDFVPIIPNKGQVLVIHAPGLELDRMVNFGRFIIPLGNDRFKLGGIYEYEDPDPLPTEMTRVLLLRELAEVYGGKVEVEEHLAGHRPTVNDRKPILGEHPQLSNVYVFNGLGSKGVMLAPYYAEVFMKHVLDGDKLLKEVDINRHWLKRHKYQKQVTEE